MNIHALLQQLKALHQEVTFSNHVLMSKKLLEEAIKAIERLDQEQIAKVDPK